MRHGKSGNLFLDALGSATFARIAPLLERTSLALAAPVTHVGEPSEYAMFPIDSIVSAVTTMHDGFGVEVMLVGFEGFYGLHAALGENLGRHEAMVQIAGPLYRIRANDFARAVSSDGALLRRVMRYAQASLDTIAQYSACNRLHTTNERCARWLLMAHDRVIGDTVNLTHEFLAIMLGVRRPGVSLAAAAMEEAGFIDYRRGVIEILDRSGLEAAACECYVAVNDAARHQLGYDVRKPHAERVTDARREARGSGSGPAW